MEVKRYAATSSFQGERSRARSRVESQILTVVEKVVCMIATLAVRLTGESTQPSFHPHELAADLPSPIKMYTDSKVGRMVLHFANRE